MELLFKNMILPVQCASCCARATRRVCTHLYYNVVSYVHRYICILNVHQQLQYSDNAGAPALARYNYVDRVRVVRVVELLAVGAHHPLFCYG
jgi:hypothetical protein